MNHTLLIGLSMIPALAIACGDESATIPAGPTGSGAGTSSSTDVAGGNGGTGGDASTSSTGAQGGGGGATTGGGGSTTTLDDPDQDGSFAVAELDSSAGGLAVHAAYPDVDSGSFPVVVVGHGFQLMPSQYYGYLRRLASHGFVALTVAHENFADHATQAGQLAGGLDWAASAPETSAIADANNAGATGHSLGGKVAVLAAEADPRIKAVIALDPVDGGNGPDASALLPLPIPTAFLGETLDSTSDFGQACAPAAENFTTFYGPAASPSIQVDVLGAAHMSFIEDPNCLACFVCRNATVDDADVLALSQAYVTAFFRRHLIGEAGYDAYLTGAEAQSRYVDTGLATIQSK